MKCNHDYLTLNMICKQCLEKIDISDYQLNVNQYQRKGFVHDQLQYLYQGLKKNNKYLLFLDIDNTILEAGIDLSKQKVIMFDQIPNFKSIKDRFAFLQENPFISVTLGEGQNFFFSIRPGICQFFTEIYLQKLFMIVVISTGTYDYLQAILKVFDPSMSMFYKIIPREGQIQQQIYRSVSGEASVNQQYYQDRREQPRNLPKLQVMISEFSLYDSDKKSLNNICCEKTKLRELSLVFDDQTEPWALDRPPAFIRSLKYEYQRSYQNCQSYLPIDDTNVYYISDKFPQLEELLFEVQLQSILSLTVFCKQQKVQKLGQKLLDLQQNLFCNLTFREQIETNLCFEYKDNDQLLQIGWSAHIISDDSHRYINQVSYKPRVKLFSSQELTADSIPEDPQIQLIKVEKIGVNLFVQTLNQFGGKVVTEKAPNQIVLVKVESYQKFWTRFKTIVPAEKIQQVLDCYESFKNASSIYKIFNAQEDDSLRDLKVLMGEIFELLGYKFAGREFVFVSIYLLCRQEIEVFAAKLISQLQNSAK